MNLPTAVAELLETEYLGRARPFCLSVDASGELIRTWGDTDWCGFSAPVAGEDLLETLPILAGGLPDKPQTLRFVTISDGVVVDVLTLPHEAGHYVVLLDVGSEYEVLRGKQQSVNELRLLK